METHHTVNTGSFPYEMQHVTLSEPSWSVWRWSVLRAAGFPADYPLRLASPACASVADHLLQSERDAQAAQQAVITSLTEAKDAEPAQRIFLANLIKQVKKGNIPPASSLPQPAQDALTSLRLAHDRKDNLSVSYQQSYNTAMIQSTEQLRTLVQEEPFRQAITWQNRQALHTAVNHFLANPASTSSSNYRKHRLLLAKYLQRYSLKNDTIGFFGPVGWALWIDATDGMRLQPGPHLLAERHLYMESWSINALSQALLQRWPGLLPWAVPRLMPFAYLEGSTLRLPFVNPLPLTVAQIQVLQRCDGARNAQEVARDVMAAQVAGLSREAEVYAVLTQLHASRRITWSLDVAMEDPYPERTLRRRLERVTDLDLRIAALSALSQIEQGAQAVQQAQTTIQLDAAMVHLEQMFTHLTEQAPTRSAGQLYAGRTLVYEDCRRDVQVTLGQSIMQELERPLRLLLTSARWLATQLAQTFLASCQKAYHDLARKQGTTQVAFTQFFPLATALLQEVPHTIIAPAVKEFQQRWAQVLEMPVGQQQIHYDSMALEDRVRERFAAPGPTWPLGHYHCPDVMLAAESVEAINRGDFLFALGELHLGMNTFDSPVLVLQHPQSDDLFQAITGDFPEPRVIPLISQEFWPSTRIHQIFAQPKDYRLVTVPEVCDAPPDHILRSGDLFVGEHEGRLQVRTRDGSRSFPLLHVLGDYFSLSIGDVFALLPPLSQTPRVTFDRVVVARQAWRMAADEIPWATLTGAAESFLQVRRWALQHQLPRFLFYRTPGEKKPCFLDLTSPLYVELFVKDVRRSVGKGESGAVVSLSEMLPTPHQTWLVDANGAHYTSELRIAAVDRL